MRRLDPPTLRRVAEFHLARFPSTRANLVRVLERRAAAHVRRTGTEPPAELRAWIEALLDALEREGLVDDRRLAASKARTVRARGGSERAVRAALRAKGAPAHVVEDVLRAERTDDGPSRASIELEAARALVRRKRLGCHRRATSPETSREDHQRDLATLARAGFSYDVARRALEADES